MGLTTYLDRAQTGVWDVTASFLPAQYFQGVTRAGGIAVLLPPQPVRPGAVERVLDGIDGLVLTGGKDIDPARYGAGQHPETDKPDAVRDDWELALLRGALDRGLPVLGICRGAQLLNVAFGGTLHQHLPDVLGHNGHRAGNAVFTELSVHTEPGTRVAGLLGESARVRCYHHQAVAEVGDGLTVGARDDDNVVEALEVPGEAFALAVQWHPEETLDDLRLFEAVVDAARSYAAGREERG